MPAAKGGALTEQDFDAFWQQFTSGGSSSVRELFSVMPVLGPEQQAVYNMLKALAVKWELEDVNAWLNSFYELARTNRNLGSFQRFDKLLRAVSIEDMLKGVKLASNRQETQ